MEFNKKLYNILITGNMKIDTINDRLNNCYAYKEFNYNNKKYIALYYQREYNNNSDFASSVDIWENIKIYDITNGLNLLCFPILKLDRWQTNVILKQYEMHYKSFVNDNVIELYEMAFR